MTKRSPATPPPGSVFNPQPRIAAGSLLAASHATSDLVEPAPHFLAGVSGPR